MGLRPSGLALWKILKPRCISFFLLNSEAQGVAQNKNASLTEGQSRFRTSGGQAAKASYRTCVDTNACSPWFFQLNASRIKKCS
jgi:hypothetical protein